MVAKNEIWTPTSQEHDLAEEFRKEMEAEIKKAAIKLNCAPEELRCRVVDAKNGVMEIQRMTALEMKKEKEQREKQKLTKRILKMRGL